MQGTVSGLLATNCFKLNSGITFNGIMQEMFFITVTSHKLVFLLVMSAQRYVYTLAKKLTIGVGASETKLQLTFTKMVCCHMVTMCSRRLSHCGTREKLVFSWARADNGVVYTKC